MGWSLFPESQHQSPPWARVWFPESEHCESWQCDKLNAFHRAAFKQSPLFLTLSDVDVSTRSLLCFKELIIPKFNMYRPGGTSRLELPSEFHWVSSEMRRILTAHFHEPEHNILFYIHNDSASPHRVWLNGPDIRDRLEQEEGLKNIKVFQGFRGLTPQHQCQLFY